MKKKMLSACIIAVSAWCPAGVVLSQDTFSIIAVDPITGEVGSAGATCLNRSDLNVLINDIIPGRGGINAQALVCIPNVNLQNGMAWMAQGHSPQEILDSLLANDACGFGNATYRQYGIVDMDNFGNPRSIGYTGINTTAYANHIVGLNYAIQGNILLGQEILDSMEARFLREEGNLACRLMAALQGAKVVGADVRCTTYATSSLSAYIRVAKRGDSAGNFSLDISIPRPATMDPIDSLKMLFDAQHNCTISLQETKGAASYRIEIYPNPFSETATLRITYSKYWGRITNGELKLYDVFGKEVLRLPITPEHSGRLLIHRGNLPAGIYFYRIVTANDQIGTGTVVMQ